MSISKYKINNLPSIIECTIAIKRRFARIQQIYLVNKVDVDTTRPWHYGSELIKNLMF